MYCCRSGKRSGNLRRTIEVARKLSDSFDVTVLMGDAIPAQIEFPDNIQTLLLPSLGIDPDTPPSLRGLEDRVEAYDPIAPEYEPFRDLLLARFQNA